MSSTILLDIGNSRVKWALVQSGEWLAEGISTHEESAKLLQEWDRFPPPSRVMASNVAGEERARFFTTYWQGRNVTPQWIQASRACSGVRNLYDRPEQLGSDRWAALVGAWTRVQGTCLVIAAGTAVTVDALNNRGEFLGGLILPGKHLMLKSLATGTHALDHLAGHAVDFPRNTADAIASGIATALTAAVHTAFQRLALESKAQPACVLTGGDAQWLANQLQIGVIIAPRLVLEGLLIMAQGDEQA
jgi:type III pantothenate kinase